MKDQSQKNSEFYVMKSCKGLNLFKKESIDPMPLVEEFFKTNELPIIENAFSIILNSIDVDTDGKCFYAFYLLGQKNFNNKTLDNKISSKCYSFSNTSSSELIDGLLNARIYIDIEDHLLFWATRTKAIINEIFQKIPREDANKIIDSLININSSDIEKLELLDRYKKMLKL